MRQVFRACFGTRKRKVLAAVGTTFAVTATAVAAFILYTGANGSGNGTFEATSTQAALTINGTSQPELAGPGDSQTMPVQIVNNDPAAAHTLDTISGAFSSTPSECAAHLSMDGNGTAPVSVPAGGSVDRSVLISADASLPGTCAGGSWSVSFSGTTTP